MVDSGSLIQFSTVFAVLIIKIFGTFFSVYRRRISSVSANVVNRKIKDNEELEAATKLAQKEEMERLQRLQEIQEQVWQQAALDLRVQKQMEVTLPSPLATDELELSTVKTETLIASPTATQPTSLSNSSAGAGDLCSDSFHYKIVYLSVMEL